VPAKRPVPTAVQHPPLSTVTIIVPFYRQPLMLAEQLKSWEGALDGYRFIVVDDGSPERASDVIERDASPELRAKLELYRITQDIPWNRGGARNLGAERATTQWIVHVDIDHVLTSDSMAPLLAFQPDPERWYRFPRWRVGAADATRRKDRIDPGVKFGRIHEHVDSYLITRDLYWKIGGYDERYSGCLGGGTPFLRQLEANAPVELLPDDIRLHVYTRDAVKDASDWALSRDPAEYSRRRREIERTRSVTKRPLMLNFPWERVL
jgi:glycosyltransferase involved in cell wall biosynthesis